MIRVNLLPEEYRPTEGASWSVLLTFIVAILVVAGAGIFALYVQIKAGSLESRLDWANAEATRLKKESLLYDTLNAELETALARKRTIEDIAQSKINWAKKLDELVDLLLVDDMWFHELELLPPSAKPGGGGQNTAGSLRISCYFVGDSPRLVRDFYRQLTGHRSFFSAFKETRMPQTKKDDINQVYSTKFIPDHRENTASTLELYLRGTESTEQNGKDKKK